MALTEEQRNALAMGAQTAGYGAAIGAPIGGPVGAGIGAGVGFLGGAAGSLLFGEGETEYERERQEQIAVVRNAVAGQRATLEQLAPPIKQILLK